MAKDLTTSTIDRQNVLNNPEAVSNIQTYLGITGLLFENEYRFTTSQVANFYDVDIKTIKRYIEANRQELEHNGYEVLIGKRLKDFKEQFGYLIYEDIEDDSQRDIDVPLLKKETSKQKLDRLKNLSVFNFRAFLNLGMLLSESENAKRLRSSILDIVFDTINKKLGNSTKYINQRDEEYLVALSREPVYRKEFTTALNLYLEMGNYKYAVYTDAIYKAIFKENAKEYKTLLKLEDHDNPRDTMYAEILKLIASFEIGIADTMKNSYEELGRKLKPDELNTLIDKFANQRMWMPQLEDARTKMASRDYGLRDIVHDNLLPSIKAMTGDDYKRFLGENSKALIDRITEDPILLDVFKRLKDK